MQRIRFGLTLDGERGWHVREALGTSTVGPLGLLTILETQCGLLRASASHAERIVQMRGCLQEARTGQRFYERTFEVDELGTAATILAWRDNWYEHGWEGQWRGHAVPARLVDMAAIDALTRTAVAPGIGERLNDLAGALARGSPQIEVIELVEPLDNFSLAWRRVLALLPTTHVSPTPEAPLAPEGSMLHSVQRALLTLGSTGHAAKVPWVDDGSLVVVRAETTLAAAQWMGDQIRSSPEADRALVLEQNGTAADSALTAMDQARLGVSEPSAFRPALQVLPLAMRLIWAPLDFKALMQFLTHPVGPIKLAVRRQLADKMAAKPGLGGKAWQEVLRKIESEAGERGAAIRSDIAFWIEHPRFPSSEQAPLDVVSERTQRLAAYFHKALGNDHPVRQAASLAAYHQTQALLRSLAILKGQGVDHIDPEALNRLISQATASGSDNPQLGAQAGACNCTSNPASLIEPFGEVVWWNMAAVPLVHRYPWSPSELKELRDQGVDLPDTGVLLERQAHSWQQPLLLAQKKATLMLPRQGEETHPAWLVFAALLEDPVILEVEQGLQGTSSASTLLPVPFRPLPRKRRWWQIPADAIHGWDRPASYSSLEQFFFNPYQWVLNYPAQLKASALLELPDGPLLLGSLAHRTVEQLFCEPDALLWTAERVRAWFERELDRVVREEGAVLLMSGRRADLESFRQRFGSSLARLHRLLQLAGTTKVEPEKRMEVDTPLGKIGGTSDLLLTFKNGQQAIVDMKWGSEKRYRDKVAKQTHMQLAIYARLVERNSSIWPDVAYYILSTQQLLTCSQDVFPGITPIKASGSSTALLWEKVLATWAWRRTQIKDGQIEVAQEDVEADERSAAPAGALPLEILDSRYNPFVNLAGWEGEA